MGLHRPDGLTDNLNQPVRSVLPEEIRFDLTIGVGWSETWDIEHRVPLVTTDPDRDKWAAVYAGTVVQHAILSPIQRPADNVSKRAVRPCPGTADP